MLTKCSFSLNICRGKTFKEVQTDCDAHLWSQPLATFWKTSRKSCRWEVMGDQIVYDELIIEVEPQPTNRPTNVPMEKPFPGARWVWEWECWAVWRWWGRPRRIKVASSYRRPRSGGYRMPTGWWSKVFKICSATTEPRQYRRAVTAPPPPTTSSCLPSTSTQLTGEPLFHRHYAGSPKSSASICNALITAKPPSLPDPVGIKSLFVYFVTFGLVGNQFQINFGVSYQCIVLST